MRAGDERLRTITGLTARFIGVSEIRKRLTEEGVTIFTKKIEEDDVPKE